MQPVSDGSGNRSGARRGERDGLPAWPTWLQIGISSMLVVLFLVMLTQTREQNRRLRQLEQRVQGLENSRALDRTSVLEQQLRAMVGRLQTLEGQANRLDTIEDQQDQWRQALQDLQLRGVRRPTPFDARPAPLAPADRGDRTPGAGPDGGGVLRPPPPVVAP